MTTTRTNQQDIHQFEEPQSKMGFAEPNGGGSSAARPVITITSPTFEAENGELTPTGSKKCRFVLPESTVNDLGSDASDCTTANDVCVAVIPDEDSDYGDIEEASSRSLLGRHRGTRRRRRRYDRDRNKSLGSCWKDWRSTVGLWPSFLLLIIGGMTILVSIENAGDSRREDRRNQIESRNGAVSSDVEACSKIGVDILRQGGNAIDAVIATGACIGTYNMFASGVGGGGFAVVRLANGESSSFNFREMAPAAAHRDMYEADPMLAQRGGLAFAIPGEVDGFWQLHKKYGSLPWEDLWKPSIELNRYGFAVTETLALRIDHDKAHFLNHTEEWSFLFSEETGELLREGEIMTRPQLANTLEIISEPDGHHEFYHGSIAQSLAKAAQDAGGIVTKEDFAAFFTVEEYTVKTTAFGREFITCQSPCSGPVLIEGLNIADKLDVTDPSDPVTIHRMVEIMKWISAGRTELGDPADTAVANEERVEELMTKKYADEVISNISDDTTYPWQHYRPSYEPNEPKGTSHISVLDKDGNAVALTTTVNLYWGNFVHDTQTGIVLNSEMDDFSIPSRPNAYDLRPSIYNYIKPFKRPLSSTTPTISVEADGKPGLVIGASGGSRIVTSVFECIVKSYLWGYDLLDTVKSPRIHHQLLPEVASVEKGVSPFAADGLRLRGHNVTEIPVAGSVVGAIRRLEDGRIFAVADWWRKKGRAAGY
ncbi:gamma-glutamyltranspeptidase-domain-containing protein [Peziza echinospora]|nr:gamma-glutamyltranspeptidase-domain-containing protein [Peziza echinospora]